MRSSLSFKIRKVEKLSFEFCIHIQCVKHSVSKGSPLPDNWDWLLANQNVNGIATMENFSKNPNKITVCVIQQFCF